MRKNVTHLAGDELNVENETQIFGKVNTEISFSGCCLFVRRIVVFFFAIFEVQVRIWEEKINACKWKRILIFLNRKYH